MFRGILIFSIPLLLICACATTHTPATLSRQELRALLQQTDMVVIHTRSPDFFVPGEDPPEGDGSFLEELIEDVIISVLYEDAIYAQQLRAGEWLSDPAKKIKRDFVTRLTTRVPPVTVRSIEKARRSGLFSISSLKKEFGEATVLEIESRSWGLYPYRPFSPDLRLQYTVRAKLIRLEDKEVLWVGDCKFREEAPKEQRHTITDFRKNEDLLQASLDQAAENCSSELLKKLLGESTQEPAGC